MDYKELTNLGLAEKEAKVYLASLELGESGVQKIAEKSGVNRATTYVTLDNLMNKGLVSTITKDKKQYFHAESPEKIDLLLQADISIINKKQDHLKKLLPKLHSINNREKDKPTVRYFEGHNGVRAMIEEMFETAEESTVHMAYSVDAVNAFFADEEKESWKETRNVKTIKTKVIYTYKEGELTPIEGSIEKKVDYKKYPIKSDIAVYGNKIRMASLHGRQMGIIVEDQELADSLRAILDLAWKGAQQDK